MCAECNISKLLGIQIEVTKLVAICFKVTFISKLCNFHLVHILTCFETFLGDFLGNFFVAILGVIFWGDFLDFFIALHLDTFRSCFNSTSFRSK